MLELRLFSFPVLIHKLDHLDFIDFLQTSFCPLGFVQFLQYYYQSGCLYRLRALGERNQLDLTVGKLFLVVVISIA